jgi:hypothetical protein
MMYALMFTLLQYLICNSGKIWRCTRLITCLIESPGEGKREALVPCNVPFLPTVPYLPRKN